MPDDRSEQAALFAIEGPDEDGCVWACSPRGRDVWCQNLGAKDRVVETFLEWLESIDEAPVTLHMTADELGRLDAWIAEQPGDDLARRVAIRRLIDLLLA